MVSSSNRVADLHIHSNASDGMDSPVELVRKASQNGISAIAITDHDTVSGIKYAMAEANSLDVEIIPGAEFSVSFKPVMHILGLFLDIENQHLVHSLDSISKTRKALISNAFRVLKSCGIIVNPRDVLFQKKSLSLKKLTEYLVENKLIANDVDIETIFFEIWKTWHDCLPTPAECISLIHSCNGIAILAHPQLLCIEDDELKSLLKQLCQLGLDGVEVFHPKQSYEDRRKLLDWANEMNLFVTGGSDYHGNQKWISSQISDIVTPYATLKKMKIQVEDNKLC